jgi:AcrR family transcriptional regulator
VSLCIFVNTQLALRKIEVARNAQQTREKLLEAAADEFSSNGLAGARIDRIAANAGVSKPMIYSYLGSKEQLFDAVFQREVLAAADIVRFDVDDLPEYAARTYDLYISQPRLWRLLTWARLERGTDVLLLAAGRDMLDRKVQELVDAQARGLVSNALPAFDLIRVITSISQMWCLSDSVTTADEHAQRRSVVHRAVAQITAPG